jgi:hypothetical protein
MNCVDAEILICDYATLTSAERFELERHLGECPSCAELARDSAAAVRFLKGVPEVEPPAELVNRILFDERWKQARGTGVRNWFGRFLQPMMQPRLVMGMALTILFMAWMANHIAPARALQPADFSPARIWQSLDDRVYRGWQRTVKYYESVKFVYTVRSRLQEWNQQQDEEQQATAAERKQSRPVDEKRLPVKSPANAGSSQP